MDPISAATGIIGLFSTCRDCYLFFGQLKNADKDMRLMIDDLDIEASFLDSWGYYWGIHPPGSSGSSKLKDYLKQNEYKEHGVAKTLLAIAELMTDDGQLLKEYGVKLSLTFGQDKNPKISEHRIPFRDSGQILKNIEANKAVMRSRMGLLRRCKWTILGGKDRFSKLLGTLRRYNQNLHQFCPEGAEYDLSQLMSMCFLNNHHESIPLRLASIRIGTQVQKEEDPSTKRHLELLRDMVNIKGKAGFYNTKRVTDAERHAMFKYKAEMLSFRREANSSTLAVLQESSGRVMVYVEFKSYRDDSGHENQYQLDGALKLARLILDREASYRLKTMQCLGLYSDSNRGRIGFVFKLPSPPIYPWINPIFYWNAYEPHRLITVIYSNITPFELGWRFELAKRLVGNVIRLHSVGWLHKNIRSSSVLLCPQNLNLRGKLRERDYCEPLLMGYDFIRIEADPTANYNQVVPTFTTPNTMNQTAITNGADKRPDIYHHPDKRNSPGRAYQYAYDIYSLGLLLIEIGLWKPLYSIVKGGQNVDPNLFQKHVLEKVDSEVAGACGRTYANVVRTFITMQSKGSPDSMKIQRDTCAKMASELSRCVA
ncbi:uncharacterized protein GGS22DRAFT_144418 [Annulohypoxylon maeteangense]|uniref:uncharacterized protein n=1 Tax=Annulohypoxylon maeteangense TaxID=1927788 RepID=UPI0020072BE8|nr:uncharacterized protein GGS22DRAFT_144418 [Annulohypoxylon maeteangense]KAI0884593.1 hypothetical protein GGS22DRAFT_144418 [Annulohypoxylon maeteangense]